MPVEALASDQQDLLFTQKIEGELLVIGDVELLGIDLGENSMSVMWKVSRKI